MSSKITIIGAGSVGSTIAYTLSNQDIASEIVLIDINKEKVAGEVMDIIQGTCFRDPINIKAGEYEDAKDSNIVIITSGIARKPGQTRIELAQTNVNILKDITPKIVKEAPNALYVIVSNPVDIMTYVFTKISGLPENQVVGSGTILDTARLRCGLAEHFDIAQKNIHAYVFGEHGDTSFIPWSRAHISCANIDEYTTLMNNIGKEIPTLDKDAMLEYVQKSGGKIIANKGATFYAVSASVCRLCGLLLSAYDSTATVSSMMHGEYGIDDVCLSTLSMIGPNGLKGKVPVPLTDEEVEKLVRDTKQLQQYQEEPSAAEDLEKIPVLRREDISREIAPIYNEVLDFDSTPVVYHEIETNGIGYVDLLFDLSGVSEEMLPYAGILQAVLGIIDTNNYEYGELFNEINVHTGGIGTSLELYPNVEKVKEKEFKATFEIKTKALYGKLPVAFCMMQEILTESQLTDEKRLKEILSMAKSRLQMRFQSSGHTTAALRAMSYASPLSKLKDLTSGIGYYEIVKQIEEHFEEEKDVLIKNLQTLTKLLFRPENMMVSYTAAREGMEDLEKLVSELKAKLFTEPVQGQPCVIHCEKKNEGFKTSSKVQYVARAGNFIDGGASYTGALQILKVILSYDYLWQNVRVKGGAYGCMSNFTRIGDGYFVSYRDPNLEKTNEIYEGVAEYLRQFSVGERDMTKYIIGTISNIDQPMTPALKGERSMNLYMNHVTAQMIEEERTQILDANEEDIRALAEVVEAVLGSNQICVIGSEEKIEEQKSLFKETKSLF